MKLATAFLGVLALAAAAAPGYAQTGGVDRLYILDCGRGTAADQSRWSPGVNVGKPLEVVDNCYLIHHTRGGFLMWDTGVAEAVAAMPDGQPGQAGAPTWKKAKTIAAQLEQIGVKPADVRFVAVSHTHADHVGNVEMFPQAMLLVQKAEYEWPAQPGGGPRFKPEHPVTKLDGDHDVFGDGSVTVISTPGHTPGHQSLMVRLPKTGVVLLSGDAVHFRDNWENRRIPAMNVDKDKTVASMQRLADLMQQQKAELWINHDIMQASGQKHAPEFYE